MKKLFPILMMSIYILSSCEDVIDLDLPVSEPLIVINGRITDSDSAGVTLSTTAPYFSQQQTPRVGGAIISLIEDGVEIGVFAEDSTGYYRLDYKGIHGKSYKIKVIVPSGNSQIGAGTWESIPELLKPVAQIDSIYSEFIEDDPPLRDGLYPFFTFTDLADQRDYYRLRVWRNDSIQDAPTEITTYQDDFWNGRSFDNQDLPAVRFTNFDKPSGTLYKIEQSSASLRYFEYLNLLFTQTAQVGSTFDPPPAPLIGNIRSMSDPDLTSLGFFNASSIATGEVSL